MADDGKKGRGKYTVLLVSDNAQQVRQFHMSADIPILILVCMFVLVFTGGSYVAYTASQVEQMQREVDLYKGQAEAVSNENIVLQADMELLVKELRDAKVQIDTGNFAKESQEKETTLQFIPSGLPMDGTVSVPSEFTNENQFITFQAGYGSRVVASADGTVSYVGEDAEYGYVVHVDHGNGYISIYKDKSEPVVNKGDRVIRGMTLYVMKEEMELLTYQITYDGGLINPMTILEING